MDIDDILFQMKLKIWDEPIAFPKFTGCLRRLDPSFSDGQLKMLFDKLKGQDGKIDIQVMLSNFAGTVHDTVDYRHKMFKSLYKEIYKTGLQDELLRQLEAADERNDGRVSPKAIEKILKSLTGSKFTDEELLKFTRQLQKDDDHKVKYIEFMDRITAIGNKEHNPFKSIMQRLAFFLESNKINTAGLIQRLSLDGSPISVSKFTEFLKAKVEKRKNPSELFVYAQYMDVDKDGFINLDDINTCMRNINSQAFFKEAGSSLGKSTFNSQHKFFMSANPASSSLGTQSALSIVSDLGD